MAVFAEMVGIWMESSALTSACVALENAAPKIPYLNKLNGLRTLVEHLYLLYVGHSYDW